jgi:hypothetical protein
MNRKQAMTDNQTPTVEPKSSEHLAGFWNSLSKNAKIAIGVVLVVIVIAIASSGGGGNNNNNNSGGNGGGGTITTSTQSFSEQWSAWKPTFLPIISQTQSDYTTTAADLTNGDQVAATSDFATLSQDATDWINNANSPSSAVNNDIQTVGNDLQNIATTGLQALNSYDLTAFSQACQQYNTDTNTLANDIAIANSN